MIITTREQLKKRTKNPGDTASRHDSSGRCNSLFSISSGYRLCKSESLLLPKRLVSINSDKVVDTNNCRSGRVCCCHLCSGRSWCAYSTYLTQTWLAAATVVFADLSGISLTTASRIIAVHWRISQLFWTRCNRYIITTG